MSKYEILKAYINKINNVYFIKKHSLINLNIIKYEQHPFHLVKPSPWPILTALYLSNLLFVFTCWLWGYEGVIGCEFIQYFSICAEVGFPLIVINWLWDIINEATFEGRHTKRVQKGLKIGFVLFLVSEVIFFFAFFWAFFYSSVSPALGIGYMWPPRGIVPISPFGLPLYNTIILISSGITVTWAHKVITRYKTENISTKEYISNAIKLRNIIKFGYDKNGLECFHVIPKQLLSKPYYARKEIILALLITILLGVLFTAIQLYEYKNAQFSINDSIFGSTFYILTGLHGLHVIVGTVFLGVGLVRHIFYHFQRNHHLGFTFAVWYWHFVDVIWIALYLSVYVWGGNSLFLNVYI
jgi:cytochrome c oxidase subunit 3